MLLYTACAVIIVASVCNALVLQNPSSGINTFRNAMLNAAKTLCPLSNICGNNNLSDVSKTETGKISCCQDCSCDADCSMHGYCCFPTEAEKTALRNQRKYQECIGPHTLNLLASENTKYRFYYMTTSCPDEKDSGQNNTYNCGNVQVAPWGSLSPIYSKSTGKIYKNRVCADCHGVRDGDAWLAQMNCKAVDIGNTRYISVTENFNSFSYNSFSEYCHIYFTFRQTLDTEICFPDIIDTCNETDTSVLAMSAMTTDDVIEACTSGIAAPFHFDRTYANVFCFLCNGGESFTAEYCFSYNSDSVGPPINERTFTFLLDTGALTSFTDINVRISTYRPIACMNSTSKSQVHDACVNIQCPSGQIYDINFKCFHPAVTWLVPYHIALRLKLDSDMMNMSTLMTLLKSGSEVSSWMFCPWPKRWAVNYLFYELEEESNQRQYIGSFIIFLTLRHKGKEHHSVLNEVKHYMSKPWKIMGLQAEMSLISHFLEYNALMPSTINNQIVPTWYDLATRNQLPGKIPYFRQNSIFPIITSKEVTSVFGRINKMNFCKMISLGFNGSDYSLLAGNTLLSYNDVIYFDGEFEVISNIDGTLEPRICLGDSPFIEKPPEVSSSTKTSLSFMFSLLSTVFANIDLF